MVNAGSIRIKVLNKKEQVGSVRVKTVDASAIAGQDYEPVDEVVGFTSDDSI